MSGGFAQSRDAVKYLLKLSASQVAAFFPQKLYAGGPPDWEHAKWKFELDMLDAAHIFEFPPEIGMMMAMTDNEPHDIKLPFPQVFIDAPFSVEAAGVKVDYVGVLLAEQDVSIVDNNSQQRVASSALTAVAFARTSDGIVADVAYPLVETSLEAFGVKLHRFGHHEYKTLRNVALNFLDLLDSEDVNLVQVDAASANARRAKRGLPLIGGRTIVRLNQKLTRYIYQQKMFGEKRFYSHRFWVRGHWMHWRDARYVNKQGQKTWTYPYVKGDGLMVKKTYQYPQANTLNIL